MLFSFGLLSQWTSVSNDWMLCYYMMQWNEVLSLDESLSACSKKIRNTTIKLKTEIMKTEENNTGASLFHLN